MRTQRTADCGPHHLADCLTTQLSSLNALKHWNIGTNNQREPKILKLERGQSSSKISFDDTMDIDRPPNLLAGSAAEPDSSEEDSEVDNR